MSFITSIISSNACFQLIHLDVWGPYHTPSLSGACFFLTIVDDYSRNTWVYLMNHKSDVNSYILQFFAMARTQFNCQIRQIRTDNGREFFNNFTNNYFASHGIIHQSSCIDTPQQNGVVKCKHRHLLNMARCLRFQAHLPKFFWGDCILTAAYLINRLPTSILNGKTPYALLFQKSPSYSHLRIFGCLCYDRNTSIKHKFDHRASPGIFIGYPYAKKGYKIFDLISQKIYTSRDVVFHEKVFPYQS